jgi:non-heme chloroperoxidase
MKTREMRFVVHLTVICSLSFLPIVAQQNSPSVIREDFASISPGIRIHYLQAGAGNTAAALVLIPGWRLPASLWREQLTKFSGVRRVVAVDPRSQGPSTKTQDDNTPDERARDLRLLLSHLGISRCVLVGWSQGAQDVAAYLQQFGSGSVAGVVFVDSPVSAGPGEIDLHKQFSQIILSGISSYSADPKAYSEGMLRSIFKRPHPDLDLQSITRSMLETPTDTGIAMLVADIFGADRRAALTKLDRPALVIASAESPLLEVQKQMAASIPNAKFVAVAGAGHAVFVDAPDYFDHALAEFLQSIEAAGIRK